MKQVHKDHLTSVCTIAGLCVLSIFTVWKMSTTPSYLIRSKTMLRVMKTPVLPTPALSKRKHRVHKDAQKWCCIYLDKFAVRQNIVLAVLLWRGHFLCRLHLCYWLLTYSGPRSVHLGQTALLFYVLDRWSRWSLLLTLALLVLASLWTETALLSATARPVKKMIGN